MRPPYSPAIQMALGSLGVLSLAQLAGAAEASPLDTQGEPCPSCGPAALEDSDSVKKPVAAAVIRQPADPAAKHSPNFSASNIATPPADAGNAEAATPDSSAAAPETSEQRAAADPAQATATELAAAPVPEATETTTQPAVTAAPQGVDTAIASPKHTEDGAELAVPDAVVEGSAAVLEDSGHNHQGVGSLAHSQSLPQQTREPGHQPSLEDFSFESEASSPRLSGQSEGSSPSLPHFDRAGGAHPTVAEERSREADQGEAGLVGSAHPTAGDTSSLELAQESAGSATADQVNSGQPSAAALPSLVSVAGEQPRSQNIRNRRARGSSPTANSENSPRSAASGLATAKRPISLPQVVSHSELSATDVMSVWNRSIPVRKPEAAQPWHRHIPPEAMPTAVVQAPASRATPRSRTEEAGADSPSIAMAQPRRTPRSEPILPVFESPSTKAKAHQGSAAAPSLATARAELEGISTASQDLLAPQDTLAQADATEESQREDLLIEPLATDPVPTVRYAPSPNAGIPSAFGAAWGDLFVSATAAGADRIRDEVDGSISAGLGLGNPRTAVGVELAYNLLSIRNFAENGSFDAKVHREVFANDTTQAAVALGWNNFVNYGDDVEGVESSPYGVVSAARLLQPNNPANRLPITGTLGVGGGSFSDDGSDVGVLAGVGLQVDPQLSLNAAWSGVGLNVGASLVPLPEVPLTITAVYGDITNNTDAGSVATLTIGYGFNFGPRF